MTFSLLRYTRCSEDGLNLCFIAEMPDMTEHIDMCLSRDGVGFLEHLDLVGTFDRAGSVDGWLELGAFPW